MLTLCLRVLGFLVGPAAVLAVYAVHRWKPQWGLEQMINFPLIFFGATTFPVYTATNFLMELICALVL